MNMKTITYLIYLLALCIGDLYAWRVFYRGRQSGGNLGLPGGLNNDLAEAEISEEWFPQSLDHFNPTDIRTWQQRYFTNQEFYKPSTGGPVFLMIGGEGEASAKWMTKGAWIDYAKRFGALCFQLEHRYYGKSHPTADLSTKNLQYLTSQQALADLAEFTAGMNDKYGLYSNTKWIAFGGSYPGSLAAWLRLKYPHIIHGAMSASGPLLAEVDFRDYFRVVDESLRTYSEECVEAVQEGNSEIDLLLRHMIGQRSLNKKFKLCDPIEKVISNANDVANFYESLSSNFAGVVQYNKDNRIGGNSIADNITIDTLCKIMTDQKLGPPVNRLAAVNSLLLEANDQKCLDYNYEKMIDSMRNISWGSEVSEGGRQWTYQTCTEFGFFQSSSYKPHIFGDKFPAQFFIQQCMDIFGPKFNTTYLNSVIERTNNIYGAKDIEVTNVVFVHGSIDPWHALGIIKTVNQGAPAIYIEGTAHCANMYPESENDLPQLKAARVEISQHIDRWIRL